MDRWLVEHEESDPISKAVRRVKELEATGAQVLPLAVDVTVAEQVEDTLAMVARNISVPCMASFMQPACCMMD